MLRVRVLSVYQFGKIGKFLRFEVKRVVRKALEMVCDQLPEPTKANTYFPNSHILIDLMNEFLSNEVLETPRKTFKGLFKMAIIVYDFDHYYRERIDWVVKRLKESNWEVSQHHENPRPTWWMGGNGYGPEKIWAEELVAIRKQREVKQSSDLEQVKRLKVIENLLLANKVVEDG